MKKIKLTQGKYALVDDEDFDFLNQWKWTAHKVRGFYAERFPRKSSKYTKMSRLIMKAPKNLCVDHINGDTLDNRKSNLRLCTMKNNIRNSKVRKDSKSIYKGVKYMVKNKKWISRIRLDGKCYFGKLVSTEKEAALGYNKLALKYHGKFARLNKI